METPDKQFYVLLGENIRKIRNEKGLSTRQVAERMGGNTSKTTVLNYEKGSHAIQRRFDALCKALEIDPKKTWDEAYAQWHRELERQWSEEAKGKWQYITLDKASLLKKYDEMSQDHKQQLINYADFLILQESKEGK